MTIAVSPEHDHASLEDQLKNYVQSPENEPVYVRSLMEKFGNDLETKDQIRSLVWALISRNELILDDKLTLSTSV